MSKSIKSILKEIRKSNKEHGHGETLRHLLYAHLSMPLTAILAKTNITPNIVTTISTILGFVAAYFFYKADYLSLIIGAIFITISYTLDCVDGELARYKNTGSKFGAWWDSVGDRLVEYVVFSSLTMGLYFKTNNPTILIVGFFGFANLMMIPLMRNLTRVTLDPQPKHELKLGKINYLGGTETFRVLVTLAALLNQVYYFIWLYALLGAAVWIRQIYRVVVRYKN